MKENTFLKWRLVGIQIVSILFCLSIIYINHKLTEGNIELVRGLETNLQKFQNVYHSSDEQHRESLVTVAMRYIAKENNEIKQMNVSGNSAIQDCVVGIVITNGLVLLVFFGNKKKDRQQNPI